MNYSDGPKSFVSGFSLDGHVSATLPASWYYDPADPSNNTLFALVLERHTWEWWAASMMVLISLIPNC